MNRAFGVDFSGAKLAGRNAWIAECEVLASVRRKPGAGASPTMSGSLPTLALVDLNRLETLAGTAERTPALEHLVGLVRNSQSAVWGFDCTFGLPLEFFKTWPSQFKFLHAYNGDAYACGLELVRRSRELTGTLHVRRATDREAKAPFDVFHYRIIYQTYFGMRDVIGKLRHDPATAVLPFQYSKLPTAERVLMECCPSSVLQAAGLPHQNYKQPKGGPLTRKRLQTRHAILRGLEAWVEIAPRFRRIIMRNGGGDAIDAVLAAAGAWRAFHAADHAAIRKHPRYRREGYLFR